MGSPNNAHSLRYAGPMRQRARSVEDKARRAEDLLDELDGATPVRAADLCLGLIEARIEAWAAYVDGG